MFTKCASALNDNTEQLLSDVSDLENKQIKNKTINITTSGAGNIFASNIPELSNDGSNFLNCIVTYNNVTVAGIPWIYNHELLIKIIQFPQSIEILSKTVTLKFFYY